MLTSNGADEQMAIRLPLEGALEIGSKFKQDTIFFVESGTLQAHNCVAAESATVETFANRLTTNNNP